MNHSIKIFMLKDECNFLRYDGSTLTLNRKRKLEIIYRFSRLSKHIKDIM